MNRNFDRTFHYFRAFAIFSVLGAHVWFAPVVPGLEDERRVLDCLRSVLFHSSTLYFIFISGYLFDYVYKTRVFNLGKFYFSKVKNVLCPYVFLSTIFILAGMIMHARGLALPNFINHGVPLLEPVDIVLSYLWGTACVIYWYIPFILTVYLVSPLLFRVQGRAFVILTAVTAVIPLFIQRDELVDFFRNYCYFYPVFILGVFFSRWRVQTVAFLTRHWKAFAVIALLSTAGLCLEFYHQHLPSVETGYYVQRLAVGALVIVFFEKFPFESRFLDLMAQYSFALYFLHDVMVAATRAQVHDAILAVTGGSITLATTGGFIVEVALCMALTWAVKKIAGRWSRQFIGA